MVVRTEVCNFSEFKIYPGHGIKFISKSGKVHVACSRKALVLRKYKTGGNRVKWTFIWRRLNKKSKNDKTKVKKRKAVTK